MDKKLNILIAEDDFAIALALKTIINNNFDCELSMAQNGEEAWGIVQEKNIDLIMSDWNMPIKTGCELLADVKGNEKTKDIPFVMLTARADKDSVVEAATNGVTDYIHKPFDRAGLIEKLNGLLASIRNSNNSDTPDDETPSKPAKKREIIDEIAQKLKSDDFNLPVLSDIVNTVNDMLKESDATIPEVAEVIKNDPIVTTRLIALSNSPMYLTGKKNKTLEEAITRVGLKETTNYLWIFGNVALFQSDDERFSKLLTTIRTHAMATAEGARLIANLAKVPNSDEYYYLGLMHDIGSVLVLRILEDISAAEPIDNLDALLDTIQALHQKFGGILLKRWSMPELIQTIATEHEQLDDSQLNSVCIEVKIIHLANLISIKLGYCLENERAALDDLTQHPIAKELQLTTEQLEEVSERIHQYVAELDQMLQPADRVSLF